MVMRLNQTFPQNRFDQFSAAAQLQTQMRERERERKRNTEQESSIYNAIKFFDIVLSGCISAVRFSWVLLTERSRVVHTSTIMVAIVEHKCNAIALPIAIAKFDWHLC